MLIGCPGCSTLNRVPAERLADGPVCGKCKAPLADGKPVPVSEATFDAVVTRTELPVVVDFWAEWCGPCKRLGPTVDALATDYAGKVTIGKLNVDENPTTAFKFQIRGIPALLLFKGGQVVESVVGLAPKDELKKVIDKHL